MIRLDIFVASSLLRFLAKERRRGEPFEAFLDRPASYKDFVESLGIPHTEVGSMRMDGRQVSFAGLPQASGFLEIDGVIPPLDVTCASFLRPSPFPDLRFMVDVNVGKLAPLLRMIGLDAAYAHDMPDSEIAARADREQRVVLTRDTQLLKRSCITYGRYVRTGEPMAQLREIVEFFGMGQEFDLFSRCSVCNGRVVPVEKAQVLARLLPKTRKYYQKFHQCVQCGNLYWHGSHTDAIRNRLAGAGIRDRKSGAD